MSGTQAAIDVSAQDEADMRAATTGNAAIAARPGQQPAPAQGQGTAPAPQPQPQPNQAMPVGGSNYNDVQAVTQGLPAGGSGQQEQALRVAPADEGQPAQGQPTQGQPTQGQQGEALPVPPEPPAAGAPARPQQPAQGQPAQGQQPGVATSSPNAPNGARYVIDPRPLMLLEKYNPQYAQLVYRAAEETGVTPQRLAYHWMKESGFRTTAPDGAAGEQGPMQMLPGTSAQFNGRNLLDPRRLEDSLVLAGRYIHTLDGHFGVDTVSSVGAYQGGMGSVYDIALRPGQAEKNHPNTLAYSRDAFVNGAQIQPSDFSGPSNMTARGIVQAAQDAGPTGALKYLAQTSPPGTSMTDAFRHAEAVLVANAAAKGDYVGMQHARDYIFQLSHVGAQQYLMAADRSMQAGDSQSAAQYLARAHAFFPDDTTGHFGVDGAGNVWGERIDDRTGQPIGQRFQVTPQGVQAMLNQTADVQGYLATLRAQQKSAADAHMAIARGDYYEGRNDATMGAAALRAQTSSANTAARNATQLQVAREREAGANARATARGQGRGAQGLPSYESISKDAAAHFSPMSMDANKIKDPNGTFERAYTALRRQGIPDGAAMKTTQALATRQLMMQRMDDGSLALVDKDGRTHGYLPAGTLGGGVGAPQRAPGATPGAMMQPQTGSPVGASAGTPVARVMGVEQNLSGTVQPQQPAQPAQPAPAAASSAVPNS